MHLRIAVYSDADLASTVTGQRKRNRLVSCGDRNGLPHGALDGSVIDSSLKRRIHINIDQNLGQAHSG
jgi:hypothetical protein